METAAASLLEASGYTSSATYDALNRIVTDTTPDASVTRHSYDEGGYLTKLEVQHRGSSTWTTVVHAVEHDAHGRRTRVERGDDGSGNAGLTTSYTYDPKSQRVTRIVTERSSDSAVLQDLRYHTDAVGLVTKVRDVSQQTHYYANAVVSADLDYHYDPLYRLIEASGRESTALGSTQHGATLPAMGPQPDASDPAAMRRYTQTYEYDPADNLIKLVHTPVGGTGWTRRYNYTTSGNRLQSTSISGDSPGATYTTPGTYTYSDHYEYDEHGSMTSMPHLPTMTWGHRDELVECTVGSETLHFQYAGGQRVRKHVTKTGTTTEERVYIGRYEKYTRRISGAEDMVRETLHLGDDLGRVAMVETKTVEGGTAVSSPVGMWRHPLGNMLGTAGGETTEDGSVIGYEEYHPYGTTAYRAKASGIDVSERRYRYTGMEQDEETGLGYHTARYYAGWLGRWVSADPIGLGGGGNRFGYVWGNPVGKRDPGGMDPPDEARATAQRSLNLWVDAETAAVEGVATAGAAVSGVQSDVATAVGSARAAITSRVAKGAGDTWGAEAELVADLLTGPLGIAEGALTLASMAVGGVTSAPLRFDAAVQKTADGVVRGDAVTAVEGAGEATVAATEIATAIIGGGETAGLTKMVEQAPAVAQKWLLWARPTTAPANGAGLADDAARVVGKVDDGGPAAPAPMAEGATGAAGEGAETTALTHYWPPNRGFWKPPTKQTLQPGTRIDRYGSEYGTFASPEGTPFPARALPDEAASRPYNVYEVVEPLEVDAGLAAPWHYQPGFGTQYELPARVNQLIEQGVLRRVTS